MSVSSDPTPSITRLSVPERYRRVAEGFSRRVHGTVDWDAPTPVKEWRARDVVGHLTSWLAPMLADSAGVHLRPGPPPDRDPVGAWSFFSNQVQVLLDDPASADVVFDHPHIGVLPLPRAVDQYFTSDVVFHTWDLARATGQDDSLDAGYIAAAYEGMLSSSAMIRGSGQFGDQQPVADDATCRSGSSPSWDATPTSRRRVPGQRGKPPRNLSRG